MSYPMEALCSGSANGDAVLTCGEIMTCVTVHSFSSGPQADLQVNISLGIHSITARNDLKLVGFTMRR